MLGQRIGDGHFAELYIAGIIDELLICFSIGRAKAVIAFVDIRFIDPHSVRRSFSVSIELYALEDYATALRQRASHGIAKVVLAGRTGIEARRRTIIHIQGIKG